MTGIIREALYLGPQMVYEIDVADNIITVEIDNLQEHIIFDAGEEVTLTFQEKNSHILPVEEKVQDNG